MRRTRQRGRAAAWLFGALLASSPACGGGALMLTLTRDGGRFPVADEEVQVQFENPPGGTLARRTDARGRLTLPREYAGLRVVIATECESLGVCKRVSPPHRLDGREATMDISGGLSYP